MKTTQITLMDCRDYTDVSPQQAHDQMKRLGISYEKLQKCLDALQNAADDSLTWYVRQRWRDQKSISKSVEAIVHLLEDGEMKMIEETPVEELPLHISHDWVTDRTCATYRHKLADAYQGAVRKGVLRG